MGLPLKISDICSAEYIDYLCGMVGVVAYTPEEVAKRISETLGLGDILARRRSADLVAARTVFHRVCFLYLGLSVSEIARISNRSYSIVYYDIVKYPERIRYDFRLKDAAEKCKGVFDWLESPEAPRKEYTPPAVNTPPKRTSAKKV